MNLPDISQTLLEAQSRGLDRLDAQMLLLHALGRPGHQRAWLISHDTDALPPDALLAMKDYVWRRTAGEPLAYITGHTEFFGLDLLVDKRVLVPRPDTETLVDWTLDVLEEAKYGTERLAVLDLGTGSGAVALALKATRPALQVSAIDSSRDALAVARNNAQRLRLEVHFDLGSWLDGVQARYDAIVSNPPYVAAHDPHLLTLTHEPLVALTSGPDGINDIRRIINQAPAHLQTGGWLLLEHGYDQAARVRKLLEQGGFKEVQSRKDLGGIERCSGGRNRSLAPGPVSRISGR